MIIDEIVLGETGSSKRKAIQSNAGQQAILLDSHNSWMHCEILREGYDNSCYRVKTGDARGERTLHYHDLDQLLIIRNHPDFPRPEIR